MQSLNQYLEEKKESRINAIAKFIEDHISENWQGILHKEQAKLRKAYEEAGDAAYGTYLNLLFLPVHRQLKEAGLRPVPKLPGEFDISREWGNEDESDQQRWMWSAIHSSDGEVLGTIVTIVYHDHTVFRVPRKPRIVALQETEKADVIAELSRQSSDFGQALEFTAEYERYLASLGNKDGAK